MKSPNRSYVNPCVAVMLVSLLLSCGQGGNTNKIANTDSVQIQNVLQKVYSWHEINNPDLGFEVTVKDSFQVGLDTAKLSVYVAALDQTNLFTGAFLSNYRAIVQRTDYKLKHDSIKYYNEINFGFQEADPWTFFQDSVADYWNNFKIHNLKINADTASLTWTVEDMPIEDGYLVKLKRENNAWKVSYLRGFDTSCCW